MAVGLARSLVAESIDTFALVFAGCGAIMLAPGAAYPLLGEPV
jgi:glycerol uptake facilitator-like aquaporin